MDRKSKVLTVLAIIFLTLTVAAFVLSALFFGAIRAANADIEDGEGAVVVALIFILVFFIGAEIACAAFDVFSIIFGAVMIKRAEGKLRTFFIVDVAASGVMFLIAAGMFAFVLIPAN